MGVHAVTIIIIPVIGPTLQRSYSQAQLFTARINSKRLTLR